MAILGAGVQARTHLAAMLAVHPFEHVVVWGRDAGKASQVLDTVPADVARAVARSARDAVEGADVICTVTASREPVLRGEWLEPGVHINAVGASLKSARELDSEAVRRSRIFVDRRESAMNEAGDLLIPMEEGAITADAIVGELGELVNGTIAGRRDDADITLFKSLGLAVEDLACARYLYDTASRAKTGRWVGL